MKKTLQVAQLLRLLVLAGADVNAVHPGGEPSALFKAIVTRQVNVTLAIINAGLEAFGTWIIPLFLSSFRFFSFLCHAHMFLHSSRWAHLWSDAGATVQASDVNLFSRMFSIPCDVVPFAKLLLHADTILGSPPVGGEKPLDPAG